MARTPSELLKNSSLKVALLLLSVVGLSGCEVGGTMFQYSSGSSPFLGIDLIPKKRSTTKIKHDIPPQSSPSHQAAVHLTAQNDTIKSDYRKQPQRLNLPPSQAVVKEVVQEESVDVNFSVTSFADRSF